LKEKEPKRKVYPPPPPTLWAGPPASGGLNSLRSYRSALWCLLCVLAVVVLFNHYQQPDTLLRQLLTPPQSAVN